MSNRKKPMSRLLSLCIILFSFYSSYGQNSKSIEISLVGRHDLHGNYVSNFAGRAYDDTQKIRGVSYGINTHFRKKINKSYAISIGLGYYRLKIDKIKGSMPFGIPGVRTARSINYDDGMTNLGYATTNYFYNNLAATISLDKSFQINNSFSINVSPELIAYKTISQNYELYNEKHWKTKNNKPIEFGVNMNLGILKEYKTFYIRPSIIVPIYQTIKGDIVFYEDPKMEISKWFSGIGLSLKLGKYF